MKQRVGRWKSEEVVVVVRLSEDKAGTGSLDLLAPEEEEAEAEEPPSMVNFLSLRFEEGIHVLLT